MQNFVCEAILGKPVGQEGFVPYFQESLENNPIIKLTLFVGSVAVAGYFGIMFYKELTSL